MEEVHIRAAHIGDTSHILEQRRAMFLEIGHSDESQLDQMQQCAREYLREALTNGSYRAWLAETASGRVVSGGGLAIVPWPGSPDFPMPRRAWILGIYTDPEFRRTGIARRIMQTILDWSRNEGFVYVALHASADGRRLYETMGFQPTNEMRIRLK